MILFQSILNDAHKVIKYKLEGGPPSKIRVQKPSQKAFVLLQAAIGQHYLNDYTLRQEMSLSVEYASRVLSAAEDYSIEESKHGQVALESLLLRRCLATSLWGATDGVLNQLRGVGAKTAAKLSMNKMRTFEDIISKSSNDIEQACGRKSPFGQELKKVVSKIMSRSLKLSAVVDGLESNARPNELICDLSAHQAVAETAKSTDDDSRIVTYTLTVHTDRPGGSLMFRTEVNSPGSHRIRCPDKFGRIYVRLVSNLVGLDEQLTIDGNDTVEKSSFVLSPVKTNVSNKTNVSTVKKKKVKNVSKKLECMVHGVDDLRMSRRTSEQPKSRSKTLSTPVSTKRRAPIKLTEEEVVPFVNKQQSLVTPSPSFVAKSRVDNVTATISPKVVPKRHMSPYQQNHNQQFHRERKVIRDPKRRRIQNGSWQSQKKKQREFQQRAFGSPKENPFSKFKFDPNNVEKQLEMESKDTLERETATSTIIPPTTDTARFQSHALHVERRSRFLSSGIGTMKTPAKSLNTKFIGSARRRRVGTPYQCRHTDILRQKAAEQQAYASSQQNVPYIPNNMSQRQNMMDSFLPTDLVQPFSQGRINNENWHDNPSYDFHNTTSSSQPIDTSLPFHNGISDENWNDNSSSIFYHHQDPIHEHPRRASPTNLCSASYRQPAFEEYPPQNYFDGDNIHQSFQPINNSESQCDFAANEFVGNQEIVYDNHNLGGPTESNYASTRSSLPQHQHTNLMTQNNSSHFNDFTGVQSQYLATDSFREQKQMHTNSHLEQNNQLTNMEGMVISVTNPESSNVQQQQKGETNDAFESAFF